MTSKLRPKSNKVQLVLADVYPRIKFLTLQFKCVMLRGPTRPVLGYIRYFMSKETSLFPHCRPFLRLKVFPYEVRLPLVLGLLKRTCALDRECSP